MKTILLSTLLLLAGGLCAQGLLASSGRESILSDTAALFIAPRTAAQGAATQDTSLRRKDTPPPDFVTVDKQPAVVKKVEPYYPEVAVLAGVEGVVYVKMWIDSTGRPHDVQVVKSDNDMFNQPAIDAARQFVFTPALHEGRPVAVWVAVPFKFKLSTGKTGTKTTEWEEFSARIDSLLDGVRSPGVRSVISPQAKYIEGSHQVDLDDALFGKERGWLINGEKGRRHTHSPDGYRHTTEKETHGYLIVDTQNEKREEKRTHSIYFVSPAPGGAPQIRLWHVSR